jgi:hypothetical protein
MKDKEIKIIKADIRDSFVHLTLKIKGKTYKGVLFPNDQKIQTESS